MKDNILEFDKREISISEMIEHIKFYSEKAKEGKKLYSDGDQKGAMNILREIRKNLKEECDYYKKTRVQEYINSNKYYMRYYNGIFQAMLSRCILMNINGYIAIYVML